MRLQALMVAGISAALVRPGLASQVVHHVAVPQYPGAGRFTAFDSANVFDITAYGAIGDNSTINTPAIQAAIAAAAGAANSSSPSFVLVPPGVFKTATISLASNVYLWVPPGAVLHGSCNKSDYTAVSGGNWDRWDVVHTNGAVNTGILGYSSIGSGVSTLSFDFPGPDASAWGVLSGPMWQMIASYDGSQNQLQPITWANGPEGCQGECRPRLAVFEDCTNVTFANIALLDSADWTTLFRRVNNVLWENVTVWGSQQWPNNDGCDLESVNGAVMRNCTLLTGDDSLCLTSGHTNGMKNQSWPGPVTPTANVLIENCTLSSYSSAFKLEAIFQANHSDIVNVTVQNVAILASARGIGMQQRTGAGAFRNISFINITIEARAIQGSNWWGVGEAIWLTTVPENSALPAPLGGIHDVSFTNVATLSEQGVIVMGVGQGNVTGSGPTATAAVTGIRFANVSVGIAVLGNATSQTGVHDLRPIDSGDPQQQEVPANITGFWFEHAADVVIDGSVVQFIGPLQPKWQPNTCIGQTPDSQVTITGLACYPAPPNEE